MPAFSYTVAPFLPFTKIVSADVNADFNAIKTFLNVTKLDTANIQQYGVARDRLAKGTANYAVFNDGTGVMTEAAALPVGSGGLGTALTLTGNQGKAIVVNPGETAFILGSPSQAQLTQSFASDIGSLTAGEAISANDAVCLDLGLDGSSNPIYRVFKSDSTLANRKYNHIGFAVSAATVTAGTYTWVASANFVASNSIAFSINGRSYTVAYSTSNTVTLQAVATAMATDPDVNGAVSDGVHTVTVTGKGGLFINITGSVVTGGVSQPTITVTNTAAPSGQNVQIRNFGDLGGFTLTTGLNYYVGTAGAITNTPDTNPAFVGQAMSTSVLFVNRNVGSFQFTTPVIFVRSHGGTTNLSASATQDSEHYNFISWSAGISSSYGVRAENSANGDQAYAGYLLQKDGLNSGGNVTNLFQSYNKSSWALLTNTADKRARASGYSYNSYYYNALGFNDVTNVDTVEKWNGAAWSASTSTGTNNAQAACFVQGGLIHFAAGTTTTAHYTFNSSDVFATSTAAPTSAGASASANSSGGGFYVNVNTTDSYRWAGSWGSSITAPYTPVDTETYHIAACGYNPGNALSIINGGLAAGAALNNTATFNDAAWSASTASANSRGGGQGAVF